MTTLLVICHILAALVLILVVLLQSGKAGDLASAFGGAGTQTAFGARGGTTFLTKATTVAAVVFMLTSLSLSISFVRTARPSVMDPYPVEAPTGSVPREQPVPRSPEAGAPPMPAPEQAPAAPEEQ
jgi:preprotein translocase subunit SecG